MTGEDMVRRDNCEYLSREGKSFVGCGGFLAGIVDPDHYGLIVGTSGALAKLTDILRGTVKRWWPDRIELESDLPGVSRTVVITPDDCLCLIVEVANPTQKRRELALSCSGELSSRCWPQFEADDVLVIHARLFSGPQNEGVFFAVGCSEPNRIVLRRDASRRQAVGYSVNCEMTLLPGEHRRIVFVLAFDSQRNRAAEKLRRLLDADPAGLAREHWNHFFNEEIPQFSSSNPYWEKLYYYRWYSLKCKMLPGGLGRIGCPACREATTLGFANSVISTSAYLSAMELKWRRSGDWAWGTCQVLLDNLHCGHIPNHLYIDAIDEDTYQMDSDGFPLTYHNALSHSLYETHLFHADLGRLKRLYPALTSNIALYDQKLDADGDGLYETYPWSAVSASEGMAQFLYFYPLSEVFIEEFGRFYQPDCGTEQQDMALVDRIEKAIAYAPSVRFPQTHTELLKCYREEIDHRLESVYQNTFAYLDFLGMAGIASALGKLEEAARYEKRARRIAELVRTRMWHQEDGFFYALHHTAHQPARVKTPTGFFPFFCDIGLAEQARIFDHLFDSKVFWTAYPVPTVSLDYPKRDALWQERRWLYWKRHSWPLTTSLVCHGALRAARKLEPALAPQAEALFDRYVMSHFYEGNLEAMAIPQYFDPFDGTPDAPDLDYAHSIFIELILRHIVGFDPLDSQRIECWPLKSSLDWFEARGIPFQGHLFDILWHRATGYKVYCDGVLKGVAEALDRVEVMV